MNNYVQILRQHNLKATPQRIAIIDTIYNSGHINVDRLYENIKNKFDSISLATIYKNINSMIENMILVEVKIPKQKSLYEITKENHSHIVCSSCEGVEDVFIDTKQILNKISTSYDFEINQSDLIISGICKNCK